MQCCCLVSYILLLYFTIFTLKIMRLINYLDKYLPKKSWVLFLLYYYFIIIVFFVIPTELVERLFNLNMFEQNPITKNNNLFILVIIVGPITETLLFQYFLIKGLYTIIEGTTFNKNHYNTHSLIITIIVSSLIFGALHFFSFAYIILTSILGFFFGFAFYFSIIRGWRPVPIIFFLHAMYNLTIFILELLF